MECSQIVEAIFQGVTALATVVTAVAAIITAFIVCKYTRETRGIRLESKRTNDLALKAQQQSADANRLQGLSVFLEIWANRGAYMIRRHLYQDFPEALVQAMQDSQVGLQDYVQNRSVNLEGVIQRLMPASNTLRQLCAKLRDKKFEKGTQFETDALEVVEQTLLTFDLLAVPDWMQVAVTNELARFHVSVLRNTAPMILPFVALQIRLRGDNGYKQQYLRLLNKLSIPLLGLERFLNGP